MTNKHGRLPVPQRAALAVAARSLLFNDDTVSPRRGAAAATDCQGPIRGKMETLLCSHSLRQLEPLVPIITARAPSIAPTPDPSVRDGSSLLRDSRYRLWGGSSLPF